MKQPNQRYTMRVVAVKTESEHLKPGDLFSDRGPDYWVSVVNKLPCDQLYFRTNNMDEMDFAEDGDSLYKITIVVIDNETKAESSNAHERHSEMSPYAPPGVSVDEWKKTV